MITTSDVGVANLDFLEELFAPLTDNPFFIKNDKLQYVAANDAMLRLCGVANRRELLGRTAWQVYPAQYAAHCAKDDREILAGRSIVDRLEMVVAGKRAPSWLLFSQLPVRDRRGKVVGVAGVSRRIDLRHHDNAAHARIAAGIAHIQKHLDEPLNLKRLCSLLDLSASQLERDFRRLLRTTPRQYQQRMRIERARRLLAEGGAVAQIALSCGFSEHSAFSRRFKEYMGLTPAQYRKEAANRADHALARR
jgi:AraC-like DNA-binding protein